MQPLTLRCALLLLATLITPHTIAHTLVVNATQLDTDNPRAPIMFWRLQKVGSSSVLSILLSYSLRHNMMPRRKTGRGALCKKLDSCLPVSLFNNTSQLYNLVRAIYSRKYGAPKSEYARSFLISTAHEICNLDADLIAKHLPCAFHTITNTAYFPNIREIFLVREPISRAVSVYYFWGELSKLTKTFKMAFLSGGIDAINATMRSGLQLGKLDHQRVSGGMFSYHGNETSPPDLATAMEYSSKLPFMVGNKVAGPSYSYSAFAKTSGSAVSVIASERMLTLVLERLDESLVVLARYLHWSLADVVIAMYRKKLSPHPSYREWPTQAVEALKTRLNDAGEGDVYRAVTKLDERIRDLARVGVNVSTDVRTLRSLRKQVSELCFTAAALERYRLHLASFAHLRVHTTNKLRDVHDRLATTGYAFKYQGEVVFAFDVCGSCEAHSILAYGRPLSEVSLAEMEGNVNLTNCPRSKPP